MKRKFFFLTITVFIISFVFVLSSAHAVFAYSLNDFLLYIKSLSINVGNTVRGAIAPVSYQQFPSSECSAGFCMDVNQCAYFKGTCGSSCSSGCCCDLECKIGFCMDTYDCTAFGGTCESSCMEGCCCNIVVPTTTPSGCSVGFCINIIDCTDFEGTCVSSCSSGCCCDFRIPTCTPDYGKCIRNLDCCSGQCDTFNGFYCLPGSTTTTQSTTTSITSTTVSSTTTTTQPQCNEGKYRCVNQNLEKCTSGAWQFVQSCTYGCLTDHCGPPGTTTTQQSTTTISTTTTPQYCDSQPDYICKPNPCSTYQQPCGLSNVYKCQDSSKYCCFGSCSSTSTTTSSDKCCCETMSGRGCLSKTTCQGQGSCIGDCPCPATTSSSTTLSPTTTISERKFIVRNFKCSSTSTGYGCSLDYDNNYGTAYLVFFFSKSTGEIAGYSDVMEVGQGLGTKDTTFSCSNRPGSYYVSWTAFSDSSLLNPIPGAWPNPEERRQITCQN